MNTGEILEIVTALDEFTKVIKTVRPTIIDFGNEIKPIIESFSNTLVDFNVNAITRYREHGFTKEEAILLTLNTKFSIMEAFKNMDNTKK
jgi:hypothetical protein